MNGLSDTSILFFNKERPQPVLIIFGELSDDLNLLFAGAFVDPSNYVHILPAKYLIANKLDKIHTAIFKQVRTCNS